MLDMSDDLGDASMVFEHFLVVAPALARIPRFYKLAD